MGNSARATSNVEAAGKDSAPLTRGRCLVRATLPSFQAKFADMRSSQAMMNKPSRLRIFPAGRVG